jgi:hypothetical protein
MSNPHFDRLSRVLDRIDRPGSFCASGSVPAVLPGLEVEGMGPIGLPLTVQQAEELKQHCRQAPYGKGEETLVDTRVRRVWELTPNRFSLTNPDWDQFLQQTVHTVQEELGLEDQKLESHLYDLLLYEKGSFFLPHRDGEKVDRMVATLVIVLPSPFKGGKLIVRHDGQEQMIDFSSASNFLRIHFAAFYADCEHEVRPLRQGYRLCLVYNLTLKKGKKAITAPRSSEHLETITRILRDWAEDEATTKVAITLDHQYTADGLTWDALKGVDRVKGRVLREAAHQAGCQAHLAILTFHETGEAEDGGDYYGSRYGRYRRWDDEDEEEDEFAGEHEMGEVFESSLTGEHWLDSEGNRLAIGPVDIDQDEVLEPETLEAVNPEEEFEGYTGNAGMTLDRWYRHGAIFLWPTNRRFDILCDAGSQSACAALKVMVSQWRKARKKDAAALKADCLEFAGRIIARWQENPYDYGFPEEKPESDTLLPSLLLLDEPRLIKEYLSTVLIRDVSVDPGKALLKVCEKYGWETFQRELEVVFNNTKAETIERNIRLLEHLCLARPRKKEGWSELCAALARATLQALKAIDEGKAEPDWRVWEVDRAAVLAGLARALLATEQEELLSQLVAHILARSEQYPLTDAHVAALTTLKSWLESHVTRPSPALSHWLAACCEQLESLTAEEPQAPTDFRRSAVLSCKCPSCRELSRFLDDPHEQVHRFSAPEDRRRHLQDSIRQHHCDVDCRTEKRGRPYTLVCTKEHRVVPGQAEEIP